MSQLVGTWVSGDSGKELQYYVTQSGSPLDVTGATSIVLSLVRRDAGSDAVVVISGAIISPASGGGFRWAGANAVGLYVPQPSSRLAVHIYEARVSFVLAGATYWTESFRLAVTQWGLSTLPTAVNGLDAGFDLQDAVDALGSSGGRIDLGSGTYYADTANPDTPLVCGDGIWLKGAGPGATIIGSPILFTGADDCLEDLCQKSTGAYGVLASAAVGSIFRRVSFQRVATPITNLLELAACSQIIVEGCSFTMSGASATRALLADATYGVIEANRFEGWGAVAVASVPNTAVSIRVGPNYIVSGGGWIEDYST